MSGVLHERLASLIMPPDRATEIEIQALVWDFVDDHKAAGWTPERIIVAVKQIARDAGIRPSFMRRDTETTTRDEFLVTMVGWCIHRYYRPQ